ncbi:MAG: DUF2933 domain-containing protein [Pseudomonadota bacterium]
MEWLQNNWIWLAVAAGFMAMHLFGHGGHRHGRDNPEPGTGDRSGANGVTGDLQVDPAGHVGHGAAPTTLPSKQHRHGC